MITPYIFNEILVFIREQMTFDENTEIKLEFTTVETSPYTIDIKKREKRRQECLKQIVQSPLSLKLKEMGFEPVIES